LNRSIVTQLDVQLQPLSVELQTIEKVGEKIIYENTTDISLERISVKEIEFNQKVLRQISFARFNIFPASAQQVMLPPKFYVRGGSGDQNQILLNGVEIYNPFHSLGLFSVIDPDIDKQHRVL